jgi:hypothetical protein
VTASPYSVEEVSGSRPGRFILKTLKIVPTASLYGTEHIGDRVGFLAGLTSINTEESTVCMGH